MTKLILVRHGETDWNTEGRWQGQADVPLNVKGRLQANLVAQEMSGLHIDAIYSSDLIRALETAQVIGRSKHMDVFTDARLREIHQGEWQGLLVTEIQSRYAREFEARKKDPLNISPPGGETIAEVRTRVVHSIRDILKKHPSETVVIVSHGLAIAVILATSMKLDFKSIWDLVPGNGHWQEVGIERI